MTQQVSRSGELVSALVDGELRGDGFVQAVQWLQESDEARASWDAYHLVGDVLRSGELAALAPNDAAFVARLRSRLQGEVRLGQTGRINELPALQVKTVSPGDLGHPDASNDASFRWRMVAGFASLATVAVVGWQLVVGANGPSAVSQVVRIETFPTQAQDQVMIRDPRLDQLLAAHQQSGGISAFQMPAGFLRNATYDRPAR